ncbi:19161_t:CDS:2 [Entrophospora sp. SA101]|nr:19152_t:CDS:2 [Entrophospora sp. SA101]CAJ0914416.1 19156_t:CDS:2 [Entrophospora sp. SA101]CAJ0914429.1 19161_t:CDS:2 [Entrophospora sp. SA101]
MSDTTISTKTFVIGSRKSQLAIIQAEEVKKALSLAYPTYSFKIITRSTTGDQILSKPLFQIGEKALFTKELEDELVKKSVDLVVHSLKDLPTKLPEGMIIGAITKRENPKDAVIIKTGLAYKTINELPKGSIVGTSSVRRSAQLKAVFPDLIFQNDENGPYTAIILAAAGLLRLGFSHRISQILPSSIILHAVGQGALGVECRADDKDVIELLSVIDDNDTKLKCIAERALMRSLEGGCSVPIGVETELIEDVNDGNGKRRELRIHGLIARVDGSEIIRAEIKKVVEDIVAAEELGKELAKILVEKGAKDILEDLKSSR